MTPFLPPLRLTGARILRDGAMQRRSLAIARGRITKGPLPEVALPGCLILPGIVDLHMALPEVPGPSALSFLDRRLAAAGITSSWLAMRCAGDGRFETCLSALAARLGGVAMRAKMIISPDTPEITPARLRAMEAEGLDSTLFVAQSPHRMRGGGEGFPRALCRMAESFDALGILYGSLGDEDAETREYFRLLGAALCEMPTSRAAAATARAMNDPVLAPAGDLLPGGHRSGGVLTGTLLAESLCDALVSAGREETLHRGAWALAGGDAGRLPQVWDLISRRPARIMGLSDRGTLDHGKRADLVILDEVTGRVEATVAGGRLVYATPDFTARLRPMDDAASHAAE